MILMGKKFEISTSRSPKFFSTDRKWQFFFHSSSNRQKVTKEFREKQMTFDDDFDGHFMCEK